MAVRRQIETEVFEVEIARALRKFRQPEGLSLLFIAALVSIPAAPGFLAIMRPHWPGISYYENEFRILAVGARTLFIYAYWFEFAQRQASTRLRLEQMVDLFILPLRASSIRLCFMMVPLVWVCLCASIMMVVETIVLLISGQWSAGMFFSVIGHGLDEAAFGLAATAAIAPAASPFFGAASFFMSCFLTFGFLRIVNLTVKAVMPLTYPLTPWLPTIVALALLYIFVIRLALRELEDENDWQRWLQPAVQPNEEN